MSQREPAIARPAGSGADGPPAAACGRPAFRRSWPFLKTPLVVFLLVMGPINVLMAGLLLGETPAWMRGSAGGVLVLTLVAGVRGYGRRLVLGARGARLVRPGGSIEIPWSRVRRVGAYIPGGGLGASEYVYITTRDTPPSGAWEIDAKTVQLQNRPGLLEAIESARNEHRQAGLGGGTAEGGVRKPG